MARLSLWLPSGPIHRPHRGRTTDSSVLFFFFCTRCCRCSHLWLSTMFVEGIEV